MRPETAEAIETERDIRALARDLLIAHVSRSGLNGDGDMDRYVRSDMPEFAFQVASDFFKLAEKRRASASSECPAVSRK